MNWIKTVDKLPEPGVPVYVTVYDRIKCIRYVPNDAYYYADKADCFMTTDWGVDDNTCERVREKIACTLPLTEDEEEHIVEHRYVAVAWMSMPEAYIGRWF